MKMSMPAKEKQRIMEDFEAKGAFEMFADPACFHPFSLDLHLNKLIAE
jgi:hypothetical protein